MQENVQQLSRKEHKLLDKNFPLTQKEIVSIMIACICTFIIITIPKFNMYNGIIALFTLAIIIPISFIVKKIIADKHSMFIEHSIWKLSRFGLKKQAYTKKQIPMGILIPVIVSIISWGIINPLTFFQFDAENNAAKRLLKAQGFRRGLRKELINESDFAVVAAAGCIVCLTYASICIVLAYFTESYVFALSSLYALAFGAWNLLPVSQLDGAKLFFGSFISWFFIACLFAVLFIINSLFL